MQTQKPSNHRRYLCQYRLSVIGYRFLIPVPVPDSFAESDPRTVPGQRGPDPRVHEGEGRGGEAGRREPPCGRGLMRSKAEEGGLGRHLETMVIQKDLQSLTFDLYRQTYQQ